METNLAETQPEQTTAAPVTADSAPAESETTQQSTKVEQQQEPDWFKKRFDEITAQRYREKDEADRRYREIERRALAAEQRLAEQGTKQQAPEKPKTLADFNYDETAFQGYVIEEARKAAREAARQADTEREREVASERRTRKFQERAVAFEKENPDYRDVAHYAPISDDLAEVIQDMESGPEIAYFLGKNRDVALSLSDLPTHIAAIELGRIDARLNAERAAKQAALDKAKAEKAVSQAPPPTPKLEGNNAQVDKNDPSQMTDAEYAKWRKKQIAARRVT